MTHDDTNNYGNESVHSRTGINSNALALEQRIELVGIIEGNQKVAIYEEAQRSRWLQLEVVGKGYQYLLLLKIA